jgi:hypothetical protein
VRTFASLPPARPARSACFAALAAVVVACGLGSLAALTAGGCAPSPTAASARLLSPGRDGAAPLASPSASHAEGSAPPGGPTVLWREDFASGALPWTGLFGEHPEDVAEVYKVEQEGPLHFLRATVDARPGRPRRLTKAIHVGVSFADAGLGLERAGELRWRWRVRRHPTVGADAWEDVAASLYVLVKQPGLFGGGRGFKFAWLASPGAEGTRQSGLVQIALRAEPATEEWREERVDLCALYRRDYGPCEGERLLAIGPLTDADNSRSVAEADYASFELDRR